VFPILDVGPAAIQLPGLILLVGFWLSLHLAARRARAAALPEEPVFNAGFFALLTGLIGARLGYVLLHWPAYQNDLLGILALTTGALSLPAGALVGGTVAALYLRRLHAPAAVVLDVLAPALALMFAFISLGQLSSGAGYGTRSELPWAIELWGARRHPAQVYERVAALATLGILLWAGRRRPYEGFLFHLFLLVYGTARFFLDAFHADSWILTGGYRAVQVLALVALIVALWLMKRQAAATSSQAASGAGEPHGAG
jgi:phosphatidylglycerol---prolipoprotein diacylglyceryl transferase